MAVTRVTEKKIVRIKRIPNCEYPICLIWLGQLGEWHHWVFAGNMSEQIDVGSVIKAESYVSRSTWRPYDIQFAEAFTKQLSKEINQSLMVMTDDVQEYYTTDADTGQRVLISERDTLRTLIKSPYVNMLLNPFTWDTIVSGVLVGVQLMRVFVDGKSFDFADSGNGSHSLSFRIMKQPDQVMYL